MVLVDDRTGGVLLNADAHPGGAQPGRLRQRATCRAAPDDRSLHEPGFARAPRAARPGGVADVDTAFDLAGAVSDFYQAVGGVDLTDLIGVDVGGGTKALAADGAALLHRPGRLPLRQRVLERHPDVLRRRATPAPTTWSATR